MDPVFGLVILALGVGAGFFFGRAANTAVKRADELAAELQATRDELARHRQQVNDHFMKTGELVNAMTDGYRAVYEHLARGARALCSGDAARVTMMMPADKLPGGSAAVPAEAVPAGQARVEPAATGVRAREAASAH